MQEVFRDVLGEPDLVLTPQSHASSVEGWDLLAHIDLITAIEQHNLSGSASVKSQGMKNLVYRINVIDTKLAAK